MLGRLAQFFENDDGRLSMTRLLCFISIFPASYVLMASKTSDNMGWYIGGYVLGYVGGKGIDAAQSIKKAPRQETETITKTTTIPAKETKSAV